LRDCPRSQGQAYLEPRPAAGMAVLLVRHDVISSFPSRARYIKN
jgi:hypothetical protein